MIEYRVIRHKEDAYINTKDLIYVVSGILPKLGNNRNMRVAKDILEQLKKELERVRDCYDTDR